MNMAELLDRSPIRLFDKASEGGLKAGEVGLVTSKKGLGKTSVLVQFGMDTLLADKQLIHVSFDQKSTNVISWYDGIFTEIAKKRNLGNAAELKEQIMRKRTILNFSQDNFSLSKVVVTLKAFVSSGISLAGVVIDGVNLSTVSEDDLKAVAAFAKEANVTVWMSASSEGDDLSDSVPDTLAPLFQAVVHLAARNDGVQVQLLSIRGKKDITSNLKLDSKTLLITEK
ncbi:MAG: hypothetical protein K6F69_00265 [Treponema sp.]|nr:hypothetical protein [Treponema sp.]